MIRERLHVSGMRRSRLHWQRERIWRRLTNLHLSQQQASKEQR
jgi:hypothetical protein